MKPSFTWSIGLGGLLLLAGAMAWATRSLAGMERTQNRMAAEAQVQERARLALWRMESAAAALLVGESARPAEDYRGGAGLASPGISPQSQVLLHFELDPDGRLRSPQVPMAGPDKPPVPDEPARRLQELRARLAEKAGPEQWASLGIREETRLLRDNGTWLALYNSLGGPDLHAVAVAARKISSGTLPGTMSFDVAATAVQDRENSFRASQETADSPFIAPSAGLSLRDAEAADSVRRSGSRSVSRYMGQSGPVPVPGKTGVPPRPGPEQEEPLSRLWEADFSGLPRTGFSEVRPGAPSEAGETGGTPGQPTSSLVTKAESLSPSAGLLSRQEPEERLPEAGPAERRAAVEASTTAVPPLPLSPSAVSGAPAPAPVPEAAPQLNFDPPRLPQNMAPSDARKQQEDSNLREATLRQKAAVDLVKSAASPNRSSASVYPAAPESQAAAAAPSAETDVAPSAPGPARDTSPAETAVARAMQGQTIGGAPGTGAVPAPAAPALSAADGIPPGNAASTGPGKEDSVSKNTGRAPEAPLTTGSGTPLLRSAPPAAAPSLLPPAPEVSPAPVTPLRGLEAGFSPDRAAPMPATVGRSLDPRSATGADPESAPAPLSRPDSTPEPPGNPVRVSDFRALWMKDALLLTRRVSHGGASSIQGAWIDWPRLRAELLGSVADLFPAATLEPAPPGLQGGTDRLASLPLRFIPGPLHIPPPPFWSPLKLSLAAAWACVGLASAAVTLVLRGMMALSNRRAAFVSAVTHELRTPLATFKLYSEMLADGLVSSPDKRQHYLETLTTEADRLGHLVENVLSYSRLERGPSSDAARQRLTVEALIQRIGPRLRQRAELAGVLLDIFHDPPGSPAPGESGGPAQAASAGSSVFLITDPSAVEQIVFNLVDNACKYGRPSDGGPAAVELVITSRESPRILRLAVRDRGPGITRREARRLFRPFHKSAREAAHSAPGVGLGLALSRRLARDLGGTLEIDHTWPRGACFVLTLPLALRD